MSTKQRKYELLVDSHSDDLFRYACWVTKDKNMAEEVLQETYMRAPFLRKSWMIVQKHLYYDAR